MANIGSRLLKRLGIPLTMALPFVGENFQDQPNFLVAFTSKQQYNGTATYSTFPNARDLFGANFSAVSATTRARLGEWATNIAAASNGAVKASALKEILDIQHRLIFDHVVPTTEMITTAKGNLLIGTAPPQTPFSRGRIHINTTDPLAYPVIDPQYLAIDSDMNFAMAGARLVRRFYDTSPMQAIIDTSVASGVPAATASDSEWAAYLKSSSQ
jgi:choline dehydrogenase-like flavoprotein